MNEQPAALHLMHTVPDPQHLAAWAVRHRVDADGDLGYALHGLLRAAFGEQAPQPFLYAGADQGLLAYSRLGGDQLQRLAAVAPPDVAAALGFGARRGLSGLRVRSFPVRWAADTVLAFEVRVRPVTRQARSGCERDAFLAEVERSKGSVVDRAAVYVKWLEDHFARQRGAALLDATLVRFQLARVLRRTQKDGDLESRRGRAVNGPDVVLRGHLRVVDSAAFAELLVRGVGRHRAFGYGLLKLLPATP